jgi:hypothetical protein
VEGGRDFLRQSSNFVRLGIIPRLSFYLFPPIKQFFQLRTGCRWVDMLLLALVLYLYKGAAIDCGLRWTLSLFLSQRLIPRKNALYDLTASRLQVLRPSPLAVATIDDRGAYTCRAVNHFGRVVHFGRPIFFFLKSDYIWLVGSSGHTLDSFLRHELLGAPRS